jgi:hypothetical protein
MDRREDFSVDHGDVDHVNEHEYAQVGITMRNYHTLLSA